MVFHEYIHGGLDLKTIDLSRAEPCSPQIWARIFKLLSSSQIDSKDLCRLAGWYDTPICRTGPPGYIGYNRFLRSISGLLKNLKILAQKFRSLGIHALVSNVVIPFLFTICLLASNKFSMCKASSTRLCPPASCFVWVVTPALSQLMKHLFCCFHSYNETFLFG